MIYILLYTLQYSIIKNSDIIIYRIYIILYVYYYSYTLSAQKNHSVPLHSAPRPNRRGTSTWDTHVAREHVCVGPHGEGVARRRLVHTPLAQLRACLKASECSTFYAHTSPETHASTPYDAWWRAAPGSDPLLIPCFKSPRYEPYVVLPNLPSTPQYAEQFTGNPNPKPNPTTLTLTLSPTLTQALTLPLTLTLTLTL